MRAVVLAGTPSGAVAVVARPHRTPGSNAHIHRRGRIDTPASKRRDAPRIRNDDSNTDVATDARFAFAVERGHGVTAAGDALTEDATLGTYCHAAGGAFDAFLDRLHS